LWAHFDSNAVGWMSIDDLIFFLYMLDSPLGKKNEYEGQLKT